MFASEMLPFVMTDRHDRPHRRKEGDQLHLTIPFSLGFRMAEALAIGGGGTTVVGAVSDIRTVEVFGGGGDSGRAERSPVSSLEEERDIGIIFL